MTTANTRMLITGGDYLQRMDWRCVADPRPRSRKARPYLTTVVTLATDLLAASLALLASCWILELQGGQAPIPWMTCHGLIAIPLLLVYAGAKLYPPVGLTWPNEFRLILMFTSLVYGAAMVAVLIAQGGDSSGPWFFLAWVATTASVSLGRGVLRLLFAYQDWWGLPAVVMGSGQKAKKSVRTLRHQPWLGLKPVWVLDEEAIHTELSPTSPSRIHGVPVIRSMTEPGGPITDVNSHEYLPVELPSLPARLMRPKLLDRRFVKRGLDVCFASLLLIMALPLIAVIAVAIKLGSQGPLFYGHKRIGHNKKRFKAWKFRSMVANADEVLEQYLQEHPDLRQEWEETQKIKNDPRITYIGRLLRKTSLDELPQIWNVLCGEMSLVGPRPIVDDEIERYGDQFDLFVSVKPGITGLWQVSGRNNTTYQERVDLDIHYVHHWSPWMDLSILLRTVPVVIIGYGAY